MRDLFRSRTAMLLAGLFLGVALVAGTAAVAINHDTAFTGCLTQGGDLISLAEGSSPLRPCRSGQEQVSLSNVAAVAALQADVDALLAVIQIDPGTGAVTIASPEDLTLDSGDGDMVMIMDETMIEADATVMGDTELMQDAMVMGDTELMQDAIVEGQATVMGQALFEDDVMVMEDTSLEGQLILPDQAGVVGDNGVLAPTASSTTIVSPGESAPLLIGGIVPAAIGTILELRFEGPDGDFLGAVFPCPPCDIDGPTFENIVFTQRTNEPFRFNPGDTLRLRFNGSVWQEVSRSSGVAELYFVEREGIFISTGQQQGLTLGCTDEFAAEGGRAGGLLINASVNEISDPADKVEVLQLRTEVFPGGGPGGDDIEVVFFTVRNTGTPGTDPPVQVEFVLRCLQI